ncbi:long chain acyl-CoA synthetase 4-like [Zingiber officinale]|uniref:long chain acyl-CoA synthetase 4-like n=1 Tax=Zingiber officinale TaxID=94328 RepID=UPI001C4D25DB|nr:long chain acyl-CoA synthetase 4-like [Zingiber officinale]
MEGGREMKHLVKVEEGREAVDGRPSVGPAYRSAFAKEGFPPPVPGIHCCWDIFRLSAEKFPGNNMLGRREVVNGKAGKYVWMTYKEVYDTVIKLGASIRSCGIEQGGRCGIYGANSSEWVISMEACNAHGIYCVPLYDTLGAGAVEFILCHAEVQIAFVEEKKIAEVLKTLHNSSKFLKTIVSFGKVTPKEKEEVENSGLAIFEWDEFLCLGCDTQFDLPVKKMDDICTIMYTSGTYCSQKGSSIHLELFHYTSLSNLQSNLHSPALKWMHKQSRTFDYFREFVTEKLHSEPFLVESTTLPIELFAFVCVCVCVLVFSYPIFYGIVFSLLVMHLHLECCSKLYNMMQGRRHDKAATICDRLVFDKVKQGLGGNVRLILSGAAPLATHIEQFLRVVTCAHVVQGYGLTETCAGTFVSLPNDFSMVGTVGPPVPNVDVRLESVPEMNYDALSKVPRGEICIKGDTLFAGYYKREDLTEEVMIDGWFHTGDIGEWQPDGSMKIIDRKKNIFKLSQGEYVAVENLENIYGLVSDIDSIWIYGNSFESVLVAIVNPNMQALEQWALANGISGDFTMLCQNQKAKEYILGELMKIGKGKNLKGFEFIKAVHLDPIPFDMERDLLTPTYKKKRPQLLKYYKSVIDDLYKSLK